MGFKNTRTGLGPHLLQELKTPIAVVGLGITGSSVLRLLKRLGIPEDMILTHDRKEDCTHPNEQLLIEAKPKTLVLSPGVPINSELVKRLLIDGAQLTSELELAFDLLESEKVIGITGSVGKSTVTSLIEHGLKGAGQSVFAGGNLGTPLADYVGARIDGGSAVDWVVLELSSYQLENFKNLSCEASLLVSLTPNHMERYDSLDEYYATKLALLERTRRFKILSNAGLDLVVRKAQIPQDGFTHWTDHKDPAVASFPYDQSRMVGGHNKDNLAMALRLGQLLRWPNSYAQSLLTFPGLPHRLQNLGEKNAVLFLNDSKATTVASVLQAVDSIEELLKTRKQSWLLLGGRDKNLPWEELRGLTGLNYVFFGETASKAQQKSQLPGDVYGSLAAALTAIFPKLKAGDLVLLSPGGTSLDEFKSFEDRGRYFTDRIAQW